MGRGETHTRATRSVLPQTVTDTERGDLTPWPASVFPETTKQLSSGDPRFGNLQGKGGIFPRNPACSVLVQEGLAVAFVLLSCRALLSYPGQADLSGFPLPCFFSLKMRGRLSS